MSLNDIDEVYLLYGNPLEKRFAEMRRQLSRSRYQKPPKDTKFDESSLGLNSFNYGKVVNDHYNTMAHAIGTADYFPASEPDFNNLRLWIMTDHYGYKLFDDAQMPSSNLNGAVGQDITCYGEPKLVSGFDRGYGDATNTKKRQALYFNRATSPTRYQDYIKVLDQSLTDANKSMRVIDASSGFSLLVRVKFDFITSPNFDPTLYYKVDDDTNDNSVCITIPTSGKLRFTVSKANVDKTRQTTSTISSGNDYEMWFVYDPAGATDDDKLKIYVNGSLQTNEAGSIPTYGSLTDHDVYIGKRGDLDGGYIQGHIIQVKYFLNLKVSASEVSQHFTNKLTIANIAYGKVSTTEYSVPRNV